MWQKLGSYDAKYFIILSFLIFKSMFRKKDLKENGFRDQKSGLNNQESKFYNQQWIVRIKVCKIYAFVASIRP